MSSEVKSTQRLIHNLNNTYKALTKNFDSITTDRKVILSQLTAFIQNKVDSHQNVYLNFICTHNSRRSHLAQLWAQAAAFYYGIPGVECFSGIVCANEIQINVLM